MSYVDGLRVNQDFLNHKAQYFLAINYAHRTRRPAQPRQEIFHVFSQA
jgi:hypothetical protein